MSPSGESRLKLLELRFKSYPDSTTIPDVFQITTSTAKLDTNLEVVGARDPLMHLMEHVIDKIVCPRFSAFVRTVKIPALILIKIFFIDLLHQPSEHILSSSWTGYGPSQLLQAVTLGSPTEHSLVAILN